MTKRELFIPTRRLVVLASLVLVVAILVGVTGAARLPLLVMDSAIAVAALADAWIIRARRVEVERGVGAILSVGRANAVTLSLRNTSRRALRGTIADDPIADALTEGLPARFVLPPHGVATVRYEVTPTRRGRRDFGALHVRYGSPLGLLARQESTVVPSRSDVYPDVHAARSLEMLRRQGRQDARLGSLRVRGGDTEFERLRPYQRGDDVRHIDWRASARRDDPTVRQYQAESNQSVVFALDIGRSMRGESGGLTSVDHALNAALLAADVALRGGDRAGLLTFDDVPRSFVKPGGGRAGGRKLTRAAFAIEATFAATDYRAALSFLLAQVRARSLFVIFTNLLDQRSASDLSSSVRSLLPRHLPLCVMMRDLDVESLAVAPARALDDLYIRAAAGEALAWRHALIRSLRKKGVLVLDAHPGDVTPALVKSYLEIKARRLL
jgi:uncharacterized protein (DUF58 family)